MAFETYNELEILPLDEKWVMVQMGVRICQLTGIMTNEIEVKERDRTPNLSNILNVLNGKSVSSITDYKFLDPGFFPDDWDNILADLTIENGHFQRDISGAYCIPYQKTRLIFPNGLKLKTREKIPRFGIEVLKRDYDKNQARRRDYFLGWMFNKPANFREIIPTSDLT